MATSTDIRYEKDFAAVIANLAHICGVVPGYFFGALTQDFLDWAKAQSSHHVLAHSSISEPFVHKTVNLAYQSPTFSQMLMEDNQWGLPNLKTAIARRYGVVDTEGAPRVLLTPGASTAIYVVLRTFIRPGDEVILELPFYQPTALTARSMGAKIIPWQRVGDSFALDLEKLPTLISPRTKLIVLSNPHNPTSAVTSSNTLSTIAETLVMTASPGQVKIVVDEIFLDLARDVNALTSSATFANGTLQSVACLGDEFISINSLSKVYGLSRLRCGWVLAAPTLIEQLRKTYKLVVNIGSLDAEAVASVIFPYLDDSLRKSLSVLAINRAILHEELRNLVTQELLAGDIPQFGCIYFPKLRLPDVHHAAENTSYAHHVRIGFGGDTEAFHHAIVNLRHGLEELYQRH